MHDLTMGAIESRFADIIWNNEPISSGQLAQESLRLLGWKKNTFQGSLPAFLVAFSSRKSLTPEEVECLRRMVDEYQEG